MKYIFGTIGILLVLYLLFGPTPLVYVKNFIGWLVKILKLTGFKGILM